MLWKTPLVALGSLRQEVSEFKVSLSTYQDPVSKNRKRREREREGKSTIVLRCYKL
jgi:hypothetical protein